MADIKIDKINSITYSFDKKREKKNINNWEDKLMINATDIIGVVTCIICEENKEVSGAEKHYGPYICRKCKNAIMKVRKMFDE